MKEPMTYKDIVALHKETFGVEPVITGEGHFHDDPIEVRLITAIEHGKPYVEEKIPNDSDI